MLLEQSERLQVDTLQFPSLVLRLRFWVPICGYSPLPGQTLHSLPGGPSSPILQWNGDFQVFEYGFPVLSFSTCNFQFCLASLFAGPGSGWHCLLLSFWGLDNGHLCLGSFFTQFCFLHGRQPALLVSDLSIPCWMTYHGPSGSESISCTPL